MAENAENALPQAAGADGEAMAARLFAWAMLGTMAAFLVNNYLTYWQGFPGAAAALHGGGALALLQAGLYGAGIALAGWYVFDRPAVPLRDDSIRISGINTYLIRAAFWAVLLIGIVDSIISFMRIEGLMEAVFGLAITEDLGRPRFRGAYVHMPLIALSLLIAWRSRGLGFPWLALLVVVAELLIVIGRFIFSYEQAFMADLVRFWYAALFLFASAYTLLEEGHVRVDVLYAGFSRRTQGWVNAVGSVVMGIGLCWVVLAIGMAGKSNVINGPLLTYEVTQAGFGLYVKYLMAGFLGVFAVSMMIQFIAYFLDAVADVRDEPGGRDHDSHVVQ